MKVFGAFACACLALCTAAMAQPNVTAPMIPYKDGYADGTTPNGTASDLKVIGSSDTRAWINYMKSTVDRPSIAKATLSLYVKSVTTTGAFQVFALTADLAGKKE